jgi:hypothetical protein
MMSIQEFLAMMAEKDREVALLEAEIALRRLNELLGYPPGHWPEGAPSVFQVE